MKTFLALATVALLALTVMPATADPLNFDCESGTWGTAGNTTRMLPWIFEAVTSQNLSNWEYGRTGAQGVHGGSYAAGSKLKAVGKEVRYYQTVTGLTPGQSYTVKAWLKHSQGSNGGGWIQLRAAGVGEGGTSAVGMLIQSTSYTEDSVTVTAGSEGIMIAIHIMSGGAGTTAVYQGAFDDVSIPEPGSLAALVTGFVGLGAILRRRK